MRGLLASPLGFLIGVSLGALGGGGSILAVPALVYVAGQSPRAATTTSLAVVGLTAAAGAWSHWRSGRVRVGSGAVFGVVGVGGSIVGSQLNATVDEQVLLLAFSVVMVIAAWRMWVSARNQSSSPPGESSNLPVGVRNRSTVWKVLVAGTIVGFMTGFFGVGGGFVIVPALVLALRFPMPVAVGTSLMVIALNSVITLVQRLGTTGINWGVAVPFAVAAMLGVGVGRRVADRLPAATLSRAFVGLLLVVAVFVAAQSAAAL
jgi:uncharacterized protein